MKLSKSSQDVKFRPPQSPQDPDNNIKSWTTKTQHDDGVNYSKPRINEDNVKQVFK